MFRHLQSLFIFTSLLSLISCGDLFTKKKAEVQFGVTANCEIDSKALSNYFIEKITPELNCLGAYLQDFVKVVKTDKPGHLSLVELLRFIETNLDDFNPELIGPIKGIFAMNSLLYGDHPEYISRVNLSKLMRVFIDVNKVVVDSEIYYSYLDEEPKNYEEHNEKKAKIYEAFNFIGNRLRDEYKVNENKLVFTQFLSYFEHLDDSGIIENSKKLLFIKKIILGGKRNDFTASELKGLIERLADIGKITFDLAQFKYIEKNEAEEEDMIQTFNSSAFGVLSSLYYPSNSAEFLFTIDELFDAIGVFYADILKFKKYKDELLDVKDIYFGNNSEAFTGKDIYFLFEDIILQNLKRGEFFYRVYRLNKEVLDSPQEITENFTPFTIGPIEKAYLKSFNRIVQTYTFFKGTDSSLKFVRNSQRSPYSIFEISFLEDLILRAYKKRGVEKTEKDGNGELKYLYGHVMTQDSLLNMLKKLENLLVGEGFVYENRLANTNETVTLMTTLFQNQSNGDEFMEVDELTEFGLDLLSSIKLSDDLHANMSRLCEEDADCSLDHKGRFSSEFYRNNLEVLLETQSGKLKASEYFPHLMTYLYPIISDDDPDKIDKLDKAREERDKYFKVTENYARSCTQFDDGTPVPLESSDFFAMFVGMMAVEQTLLRFDKAGVNSAGEYGHGGPDGILQPEEVMDAFPIYDAAIKAIIPVGFLKRFSKSFYQYLIKYEKVPDVTGIKSLKDFWRALKQGAHFIGFIFKSKRKKRASADRFTIAKVLEVLADFSPESKENPFPCEDLR